LNLRNQGHKTDGKAKAVIQATDSDLTEVVPHLTIEEMEKQNEIVRKKIFKRARKGLTINNENRNLHNTKVYEVLHTMKSDKNFNVVKYSDITLPTGTISGLVDSGASITIISKDIFDKNYPDITIRPTDVQLKAYAGNVTKPIGNADISFIFGGTKVEQNVMVVPEEIHHGFILGCDFLNKFEVYFSFGQNKIQSEYIKEEVKVYNINTLLKTRLIKAEQNYVIPANSEQEISTVLVLSGHKRNDTLPTNTLGNIVKLPDKKLRNKNCKEILSNLHKQYATTEGNNIKIMVKNNSDKPVKLNRNITMGTFEPFKTPHLFANTIILSDEYKKVKEDFREIDRTPYDYEEILKADTEVIDDRFVIDHEDCILNDNEKKILRYIISKNREAFIFSTENEKLGTFRGLSYEIPLEENTPFWKTSPYPLRQDQQEEFQKIIAEHLRLGLITKAKCTDILPRVSPFILIKKQLPQVPGKAIEYKIKGGIDYRFLNSYTKHLINHPMDMTNTVIESASGKKYFSLLDSKLGYLQCNLSPKSRKDAAIITEKAIYLTNKIPYGLCHAPVIYSKFLGHLIEVDELEEKNELTSALAEGVRVYLDDIFAAHLHGYTHIRALEILIRRAKAIGITLSGVKCLFGRCLIELLGLDVDTGGARAPKSKIKCLLEILSPSVGKTLAEKKKRLQKFLGLTTYLARFGPHYPTIARPLQKILGKAEWTWGKTQEDTFLKLKALFGERLKRHFPNFSKTFYIFVDASDEAISYVLMQKHSYNEGEENEAEESNDLISTEKDNAVGDFDMAQSNYRRTKGTHLYIIDCEGRALSPSEINILGVYDKELLALSNSLSVFEKYIGNAKNTILYSDNLPLVSALKSKIAFTKKLCKFQLILSQFPNLKIAHIPGIKNVLADHISRLPKFYLDQIEKTEGTEYKVTDLLDLIALKYAEQDHNLKSNLKNKQIKEEQRMFKEKLEEQGNKEGDNERDVEDGDNELDEEEGKIKEEQRLFKEKLEEQGSKEGDNKRDVDDGDNELDEEEEKCLKNENIKLSHGNKLGVVNVITRSGENKHKNPDDVKEVPLQENFEEEEGLLEVKEIAEPKVCEKTKKWKNKSTKNQKSVEKDVPLEESEMKQMDSLFEYEKIADNEFEQMHQEIPGNLFDYDKGDLPLATITTQELIKAQKEDSHFGDIYRYVESKILPDHPRSSFVAYASEFYLIDSVLVHESFLNKKQRKNINFCVVIPQVLEGVIMEALHTKLTHFGSHQSGTTSFITCKKYYYFPGMLNKLVNYAKSCILCQRVKSQQVAQCIPQNVSSRPEYANDQYAMDFLGPIVESEDGYKYVCIIVCVKTHFLWCYAAKTTGAQELAEILFEHLCLYGKPLSILSDRGSNFNSDVMLILSKLVGFKRSIILASNSRSNGLAEANIKKTKAILTKFANKNPTQWPKFIKLACYVNNTQIQANFVNECPYTLYFGRKPNIFNVIELPASVRSLRDDTDFPVICYYRFKEMTDFFKGEYEHYYKNLKEKFDSTIKKVQKFELGSICFLKANVNYKVGFTGKSMNHLNWIGPYVVGYIMHDRLDSQVGVGLLMESLEPKLFKGQYNSIVSVRRVRLAPARSNGIIVTKIKLPRLYEMNEWQKISNKEDIRQKISEKAGKITKKPDKLPKDYFYIDKIIDSKICPDTGELMFLVAWLNTDEVSWVKRSYLLDPNLVNDYFATRLKLKKVNKKDNA